MTLEEQLLQYRSDPEKRAVLEDYMIEHGRTVRSVLPCAADADADADAADADADAADADAIKYIRLRLEPLKEPNMKQGLKLIQVAGRYGYAVTLVGWLRRVAGDEFELVPGHVTVAHTGNRRTLDDLAANGLKGDHVASAPAKMPEELHRLLVRRVKPASVEAWSKVCPRPAKWTEADE